MYFRALAYNNKYDSPLNGYALCHISRHTVSHVPHMDRVIYESVSFLNLNLVSSCNMNDAFVAFFVLQYVLMHSKRCMTYDGLMK